MMTDLLSEIRKHDRAEVSYKSGVSLSTLNLLLSGANKNPTIATLNKLRAFLDQKEQENEHTSTSN